MKLKVLLLNFSIPVCLLSCNFFNSPQANKIKFASPIDEIEDSILKLNGILDKLPRAEDMRNYYFGDRDILFINHTQIGSPDHLKLDSLDLLSGFSYADKSEFLNIINYLKSNQITGSYHEPNAKMWFYDYYNTCDIGFDDCRNIVVVRQLSDQKQLENAPFKIIDQRDRMFLIAPLTAKIK